MQKEGLDMASKKKNSNKEKMLKLIEKEDYVRKADKEIEKTQREVAKLEKEMFAIQSNMRLLL
jgi:hypothetical protein